MRVSAEGLGLRNLVIVMQTISTPCVAICRIDPDSGYCIGCGRSPVEIGAWLSMDESERLSIMNGLPGRFSEHPSLARERDAFDAMLERRRRERQGRRRQA